jgi:hypothetical protein
VRGLVTAAGVCGDGGKRNPELRQASASPGNRSCVQPSGALASCGLNGLTRLTSGALLDVAAITMRNGLPCGLRCANTQVEEQSSSPSGTLLETVSECATAVLRAGKRERP